MKAALFDKADEPFAIHNDIDIIDPRAGEVQVRVKYCGVCHSDLSAIDGSFPNLGPIILGHEASGVVEKVGPGVTRLTEGDHVVLTPTPPCGHCYFCLRGQHSLCETNRGTMTFALSDGNTGLSRGDTPVLRGMGVAAFAELVVTPVEGAVKIPQDIPLELACVIGCALQTGVGAVLNTANVEEGATTLVMGLGGIGMATVQGARIAGASVILASDPVPERRELALKFGATHVIDPLVDDVATKCLELTGNIGMDYAFETAGVAKLVEAAIPAIRMGGTIVAVGAPPLEQNVNIEAFVTFSSAEKNLCGCLLGSANSLYDIPRLVSFWQNGQLDLESMITKYRPIEEINEAFDDLKASRGLRTVLSL